MYRLEQSCIAWDLTRLTLIDSWHSATFGGQNCLLFQTTHLQHWKGLTWQKLKGILDQIFNKAVAISVIMNTNCQSKILFYAQSVGGKCQNCKLFKYSIITHRNACHTLSYWMVYLQYEFFHGPSKHCYLRVYTIWTAERFFISMNSLMCLRCD